MDNNFQLSDQWKACLFETQDRLAKNALAQFRDAVVPVYGLDNNDRPIHCGSGILLKINGRFIFLTAAHIVDETQENGLHIGFTGKIELVRTKFFSTGEKKRREEDRYDFAFTELEDHFSTSGCGKFIGLEEFDQDLENIEGAYYTALGFPNSKNKIISPRERGIIPTRLPYSSNHQLDCEIAAKLPNSGYEHIFLQYGKQSYDENKKLENSIGMKGMSGGVIPPPNNGLQK